jgi:hypothetical protein
MLKMQQAISLFVSTDDNKEPKMACDSLSRGLSLRSQLLGVLQMIVAECSKCGKKVDVPTRRAQYYVMMHKIPCRACYQKEWSS